MKEPANTCPDINRCQRSLKEVLAYVKSAIEELEKAEGIMFEGCEDIENLVYIAKKELNSIIPDFDSLERELEDLRSANMAIREYGNHWEREYNELANS